MCKKVFNQETELLTHLSCEHVKLKNLVNPSTSKHQNSKKKSTNIGEKASIQKIEPINLRTIKKNVFFCPTCTYSCRRYSDCVIHVAMVHNTVAVKKLYGDTKLDCGKCYTRFTNENNLVYHLFKSHDELKIIVPSKEDLKTNHFTNENVKIVNKSDLDENFETVYEPKKIVNVNLVQEMEESTSNLTEEPQSTNSNNGYAIQTKTGTKRNGPNKTRKNGDLDKNKCDFCDVKASCKQSLNRHMAWTHFRQGKQFCVVVVEVIV